MILETTIHCPECGKDSKEVMQENVCVQIYRCPHCKTQLKPKAGECCAFCSYGDTPCLSAQMIGSSCCGEFTS